MAKPAEIKKMAALLETEADSSEEMAKKVWDLVEQLYAERTAYVVVAVHPSIKVAQAVGPYNTQNQLMKDYKKRIARYDASSFAVVAQLKNPDTINL